MPKKGVLLVNLGSPDSFSIKDIKRYLKQFLMDKYVIDLPYLLRYALVHGIILNTRPPKTSKAYQKIWWNEGSPLIVISNQPPHPELRVQPKRHWDSKHHPHILTQEPPAKH